MRLIGYALFYDEQVTFGRGLSDVDEPALWEKSLDGRVLHWIEVGQPDADRITWCSRRTEKFTLLAYGNLRVWQTKVLDGVRSLKNINVVGIDQEALAALALDIPRSLNWSVMISEGELFVTDERGQHEIPLQWLAGVALISALCSPVVYRAFEPPLACIDNRNTHAPRTTCCTRQPA